MIEACIGLGSNLGDSLRILRAGWQALGTYPGITLEELSSPYRSEPVDMTSPNWFVNAAGRLLTSLAPAELLAVLLDVEARFGRTRTQNVDGYQDRTLDLDLLFYGDRIVSAPDLAIPHPHLAARRFVLAPLCEIVPAMVHPQRGMTVCALLAALSDRKDAPVVERVDWPGDEPNGSVKGDSVQAQ